MCAEPGIAERAIQTARNVCRVRGVIVKTEMETKMPLFLLPYLYMQIAVSGGASVWSTPTTADHDD